MAELDNGNCSFFNNRLFDGRSSNNVGAEQRSHQRAVLRRVPVLTKIKKGEILIKYLNDSLVAPIGYLSGQMPIGIADSNSFENDDMEDCVWMIHLPKTSHITTTVTKRRWRIGALVQEAKTGGFCAKRNPEMAVGVVISDARSASSSGIYHQQVAVFETTIKCCPQQDIWLEEVSRFKPLW